MLRTLSATLLLLATTGAAAQMVESVYVASNSVKVSVNKDDFAQRAEYTAPTIKFPDLGGFALVAMIKVRGQTKGPIIVGSISYNGEWRRYNQAILRGGETVEATFADREVISCRGSRYSGCSLREGFEVRPTKDQIAKYAEAGVLKIQMRAQAGQPVLMDIPVTYFDAVSEAAIK